MVKSEILRQAKALYERDYLYRYQGMRLKFPWLIIMPCLPLFLYNILNAIGVFGEASTETPRAITISIGITFYTLFSESLVGFAGALERNKKYIIKTGIRFRSCFLSVLFSVYSNFVIRYVVLIVILSFYDGYISSSLLIGVLYSIVPVAIGASFGLSLSIFSVFYRDIDNIVQTMAFYLLFASGVFMTIKGGSALEVVVANLPSYIAVVNGRALVLSSGTFDGLITASWFVGCILLLLVASIALKNSKPLITSYM